MAEPERADGVQVLLGFLLCGGLHVAAFAITATFGSLFPGSEIAPMLFATLGLSQLVYVLPAWFLLRRRGKRSLERGLILGAVLTLLGTIGCWGFVMTSFSH